MRHTFIVLTLLLVGCATLRSTPEPAPLPTLADRQSIRVDARGATGSGFPVSENAILTAWHVVEHVAGNPQLVTVLGVPAIEVIRMGDLDAALVVFQEPHGLAPWPMDVRPTRLAEPLFVSGWGGGVHWFSRGFGTDDTDRASIPIAPGDSGCPLLDADFEVVGIIVARGMLAHHHAFFVPITAIAPFLPEALPAPA